METTEIIDNLKDTFKISRSRCIIARSHLSRHNFISKTKHTLHLDDVFYMVYAFIFGPGNNTAAKTFYKDMLENEAFVIECFSRMYYIGFSNIKNVTFGTWYIIVNCNDRTKNFTFGKIDNLYTDRSKTVSGEQLEKFFNKLT